jgi:hypothetical protein
MAAKGSISMAGEAMRGLRQALGGQADFHDGHQRPGSGFRALGLVGQRLEAREVLGSGPLRLERLAGGLVGRLVLGVPLGDRLLVLLRQGRVLLLERVALPRADGRREQGGCSQQDEADEERGSAQHAIHRGSFVVARGAAGSDGDRPPRAAGGV